MEHKHSQYLSTHFTKQPFGSRDFGRHCLVLSGSRAGSSTVVVTLGTGVVVSPSVVCPSVVSLSVVFPSVVSRSVVSSAVIKPPNTSATNGLKFPMYSALI
eukprot:Trichotokara_eunicae@DN6356_c1_g1_i3.p2